MCIFLDMDEDFFLWPLIALKERGKKEGKGGKGVGRGREGEMGTGRAGNWDLLFGCSVDK